MSTVPDDEIASQKEARPRKLSGNMGVGELVMSVLAFSSPLTTVAGFIPVLLMFSGATAPGIYIALTIILLIFSVGFVRMSRTVENPGGFYSFVAAGLGKPAGLGGALVALFGYIFIGYVGPSLFAVTLREFIISFGGPDIPWYWLAFVAIAITTTLGYNRIDLSAKVLTTVMMLEVIVVVIFNIASFTHGGGNVDGIGFSLPWFTDASLGLALLFAVGNFFGFEATVIYRDEVKRPEKTIPRATYISVIGIGLFYAIAAWAYIVLLGQGDAREAAASNTVNLFNDSIVQLLGKTFADVAVVLLLTSIMASALSVQNIASRYSFSLAADGVFPEFLGRVHSRHRSPHVSTLGIGSFWIMVTIVFAILGVPPEKLYPIASGSGSFAVLLLMFITSCAVFIYFLRRRSNQPESVWKTVLAPLISIVVLGIITYLALTNYSELIEGSIVLTVVFMTLTFAILIGGITYAVILRQHKPDVYARLGRSKV